LILRIDRLEELSVLVIAAETARSTARLRATGAKTDFRSITKDPGGKAIATPRIRRRRSS